MAHVVFTGPQQLHRRADLLGDPRRLDHVVVGQPAAEPAAGLHQVHRDVGLLDAERLRADAETGCRRLARRPQLQLAVLPVRHAVLRLERRVRDERIHVGAFDDLRARSRERLLDVAVGAQLRRVRALAELVGLGLVRLRWSAPTSDARPT